MRTLDTALVFFKQACFSRKEVGVTREKGTSNVYCYWKALSYGRKAVEKIQYSRFDRCCIKAGIAVLCTF